MSDMVKNTSFSSVFLSVPAEAFPEFMQIVAFKLQWDYITFDNEENRAVLKSKKSDGTWSERFEILWSSADLTLEARSVEKKLYDFGSMKKAMRKLENMIKNIFEELGDEGLKQLCDDASAKENEEEKCEEYVVPKSLPEPPLLKEMSLAKMMTVILLLVALSGILYGAARSFYYIVGLYEIGLVMLLLGFSSKMFKNLYVKDFIENMKILWFAPVIFFITGELGYYLARSLRYDLLTDFSFVEFTIEKYSGENSGTGFFFLGLSAFMSLLYGYYLYTYLPQRYFLSRLKIVPREAIDYVWHLLGEDKEDDEIETLLSQKGWGEKMHLDAIWDTIEFDLALYDERVN